MFKWFGIVNLAPCTRVAAFAEHLREGRLMAARCKACGQRSFPPRADCARCLSPDFDWVQVDGRCQLLTWSRITAAPSGFEQHAPYTVAVVELAEGGRALAWIGASVAPDTLRVGMELCLVPRMHEDTEEIHVDYTLEAPVRVASVGHPSKAEAQPASPAGAGRRIAP